MGLRSCGRIPDISTVFTKLRHFATVFGIFAVLLTLIFIAISKKKAYAIFDDGIKTQGFAISGGGFGINQPDDNSCKSREALCSNNAFNTISKAKQPDNNTHSNDGDLILKNCGEEVESTVSGVVKRAITNKGKVGLVEITTESGLVTFTGLQNILVATGDVISTGDLLGEAGGLDRIDNVCAIGVFVK